MKNSGQILLGILCAASAGVVIGLLIAPEKGEDLRKGIKNSAGDWAKKFGDILAQGKEQYDDLKSKLGNQANDFKEEANDTYRSAKV